ncbi:lactonase family protein [Sphingomonas quercus]|uniref:Lactonase family protein n=1 Tax=Sphingomonas quercus TaxID=2842451 RepID=A0ABS6BKU0_9SPHN|nr:lactonase family protein [Sphingomonas quercus]MBU3077845.1 lactonase family protein [Sphingomonas quercus]
MTSASPVTLHVGTYDKGGGEGLVTIGFSPDEGWSVDATIGEIRNASYGASSARFGLHYLVDEQADGALLACREGRPWRVLARLATQGAEPCYASLDPAERWLAVANYGSGDIALFALHPDTGLPLVPPTIRRHHGSGPVASRQDGPHAHCVLFARDGRVLYHVDLGSDVILAHPVDPRAGFVGEARIAYRAPPGAGPRHLVFHPHLPLALLVCELAATLTLFDVADGRLTERVTVATAPPGWTGENLGGHLALNQAGDRAYATNRGHDSVAVFALDDHGAPTLLQHVQSGGVSPRHFLLLETAGLLVLANEESATLFAFRIEADGRLSPCSEPFHLAGAAFVLAAHARSCSRENDR